MKKFITIDITGCQITRCYKCNHIRFCVQLSTVIDIDDIYICSDCLEILRDHLVIKEREYLLMTSKDDEE